MSTKTLSIIIGIIFWVVILVLYLQAPSALQIVYIIIIGVALLDMLTGYLKDSRKRD